MGFFNGNYAKPGAGISKEEAEKRNYFDILTRHFWDLIKLNLLFFICNIVFIGAAVFLIMPYILNISDFLRELLSERQMFLPFAPFVPFMFMGPFVAGFTYVLRNWAHQTHAFVASDFFEHTKKNWKQGLIISVLSTVVFYLFLTAILFYIKAGIPLTFVLAFAVVFGLVLLSVNLYIYPMMVTFNMRLFDILKNAFIFALIKLPQNTFILIVIALVHLVIAWFVPVLWVILMVVVLMAWSGYTVNYYVWHVMDKHMLSQLQKEQSEQEVVFEDTEQKGKEV